MLATRAAPKMHNGNQMKQPQRTGYRGPNTTSRKELLIDGSDEKFRRMLEDLVEFSNRLSEIRHALAAQIQLTPPQYSILVTMSHSEREAFSIGDMANELRVSVPFIVQETNKMDEAGLLKKTPDPSDRRRVILELTEKSKKLLASVSSLQIKVNDVLFSSLSRAGFLTLGTIASELVVSAEAGLEEAKRLGKQPAPRARMRPAKR